MVASATEPPNYRDMRVNFFCSSRARVSRGLPYLEVIGDVVVAGSGLAEHGLCLIARRRASRGSVGWRGGGVVLRVFLRSLAVLCFGGHGVGRSLYRGELYLVCAM